MRPIFTILGMFLFINLPCFARPVFAGTDGHGASDIGRALHRAQNETVPQIIKAVNPDNSAFDISPAVRAKYKSVYGQILADIKQIQLRQTTNHLVDSLSGYPTWIDIVPSEKTIYYNSADFENSGQSKEKVATSSVAVEHFLHEMGHFYGLDEDDSWVFAQTLVFAYQKLALEIQPDILLDTRSDNNHIGMTESDARNLCKQYERTYSKIYFYVYCDLYDKQWSQLEARTEYTNEPRFLGYRTEGATSDTWVRLQLVTPNLSLDERIHTRNSYVNISPVIETVVVPRTVFETKTHHLFDVVIMGLGRLGALPFKTLKSSDAFYKGAISVSYETPQLAMLACREDLMELQVSDKDAWIYDRAQCESSKFESDQNEKYFYKIKTQNPFILD